MGAVKVSISLDDKQLRWLKQQAKKHNTSVSRIVAEAIAELRRLQALDQLIADLGGPFEFTDQEIAEIEAEWEGASTRCPHRARGPAAAPEETPRVLHA